jgi:vacuolar-type H+-ATPase subunit I/STV1
MEMTLVKRIMQQAGKAVCFSILALAMANCTNSEEVEEAKETAEKAKEEAQGAKKEAGKAKEDAEKMKKDLEAKIAALEAAGPLASAVQIQNDITALKTAVGGNASGLVKSVADLINVIGDDQKGLIKAINEKANKAEVYSKKEVYTRKEVYTWEGTLKKINELNTKIFNAKDDMNAKFKAKPIED